jgi:hypothetical protein
MDSAELTNHIFANGIFAYARIHHDSIDVYLDTGKLGPNYSTRLHPNNPHSHPVLKKLLDVCLSYSREIRELIEKDGLHVHAGEENMREYQYFCTLD